MTDRGRSSQVHTEGFVTGGALGLALCPLHVLGHAGSAEGVLAGGYHWILQVVMTHPTSTYQ